MPQAPKQPATKKDEPKTPAWRSPWLGVLVVGVLATVVLVEQAFTVESLRGKLGRLEQSQGGLIDEVGSRLPLSDQVVQLSRDLNEVRATLALPVAPTPVVETPSTPPPSAAGDTPEAADPVARGLFLAIDAAKAERALLVRADAARAKLDALRQDAAAQAQLAAAKLTFAPGVVVDGALSSLSINAGSSTFRRLTFHRDTGEWEIFGAGGGTFYKDDAAFDAAVQALLGGLDAALAADARAAGLISGLDAVLQERATQQLLEGKRLTRVDRTLRTSDGRTVASFSIAATGDAIVLTAGTDARQFQDADALRAALPDAVGKLDSRTEIDRRVDAQKAKLATTFTDPTFLQLLQEAGLRLPTEPRYTEDRVWYPLTDAQGTVVRQIVVERSLRADILLVDAQGLHPQTPEQLIRANDPKAPSTSRTSSRN